MSTPAPRPCCTPPRRRPKRSARRCAPPIRRRSGPGRVLADLSHVPGLVELLCDEQVSGPIYDLPRPITAESVTRLGDRAPGRAGWAGEGAAGCWSPSIRAARWPAIRTSPSGRSARRPSWPGPSRARPAGPGAQGGGGHGRRSFDWIFETLGVRLMCLTAALDKRPLPEGHRRGRFPPHGR